MPDQAVVRPRSWAEVVDALSRWLRAATTATPGMAVHRLRWVATRTAEPWETAPLPDPDRPLVGDASTLQTVHDGVGPLHRRRFEVRIATDDSVADVVDGLVTELDAGTPDLFVRFMEADGGPPGSLALGLELLARMTGPADGPVRVVEERDDGVRLATLRGHPEAGEIDFSVQPDGPGHLRFLVRSWARSSNQPVRALYEHGGGKDVQAHVWTSLCLSVARRHGRIVGRVQQLDRVDPWPLQDGSIRA